MTSPIRTITSVLKASTDIITNIPARTTRLAEILAIMSVSTFNIAVILYASGNLIQARNTIILCVQKCISNQTFSHKPLDQIK